MEMSEAVRKGEAQIKVGFCDECCLLLRTPVALIEERGKPNRIVHPACKKRIEKARIWSQW